MKHMVHWATMFFVAMFAFIAFTPTASADTRSDCIATCKGLDRAEQPACFAGCPAAGVATQDPTPAGPSKTKRPWTGKPLKCDADKHETLSQDRKSCECATGFERFAKANPESGETEEGLCVSVCAENQKRSAEGVCEDVVVECRNICFLDLQDKLDAQHKESGDRHNALLKSMGDHWLLLLLIAIFTGISALKHLFDLSDRNRAWRKKRKEAKEAKLRQQQGHRPGRSSAEMLEVPASALVSDPPAPAEQSPPKPRGMPDLPPGGEK